MNWNIELKWVDSQQTFVCLLDMSWRRLVDKQNVYWDICIKPWPTNKSKLVSNKSISYKSIFHESKANPKCIN